MASGITNKGAWHFFNIVLRNGTEPTNYYLVLVTDAVTPTVDHNTLSEFTQIPSGNGYTTNGISINRDSTDFDVMNEDDTDNRVEAQLKNIAWTASGGSLPGSGTGARWALLTDDNGTPANRLVLAWFDLGSNRIATVGQVITLADCELRGTPA